MAAPSSPKTKRLDKLLLGFMQGSDFHVSLIIFMFYKTVNPGAQKSYGIVGSENFWIFSDWVYLIIIFTMTLAEMKSVRTTALVSENLIRSLSSSEKNAFHSPSIYLKLLSDSGISYWGHYFDF